MYTLSLVGLMVTGCQQASPSSSSGTPSLSEKVTATEVLQVSTTSPLPTAVPVAESPVATGVPLIFTSPLAETGSAPSVSDILVSLYGANLRGDAEHGYQVGASAIPWIGPVVAGSFTSAGATEWAALVGAEAGNSTDTSSDEPYLTLRWVILEQDRSSSQWQTVGRSTSLGFNIRASQESWRASSLTDFDQDGAQELLAVSSSASSGTQRQVTHLFRWNGTGFADVWSATTYENNTQAESAPGYYILETTVNLKMEDGATVLALDSTRKYLAKDTEGRADTSTVTQVESTKQQFRWNGQQFAAFNPGGPQESFAYSSTDGLWLWSDTGVKQIDDRSVDHLAWSQDGQQLAYVIWWPSESKGIWVYDAASGHTTPLVTTESAIYEMASSPDGTVLGYVQARPTQVSLVRLADDITSTIEAYATGFSWSPDSGQIVFDDQGSLVRYDLTSKTSLTLVQADENSGDGSPQIQRSRWSPHGDLVAAILQQEGQEQVVILDGRNTARSYLPG